MCVLCVPSASCELGLSESTSNAPSLSLAARLVYHAPMADTRPLWVKLHFRDADPDANPFRVELDWNGDVDSATKAIIQTGQLGVPSWQLKLHHSSREGIKLKPPTYSTPLNPMDALSAALPSPLPPDYVLLVAVSGAPAAAGTGSGGGADIAAMFGSLMSASAESTKAVQSLLVQAKTVSFSKASPKLASQAMISLVIGTGGRLFLPDLEHYMPAAASLTPYEWGARESETDASKQLLPLLQSWVVTDARPPIPNLFLDVQGLASHMPIELHVESVAVFKGMPDMIVAARGVGFPGEASPTTSAAVVAVDWKTRTALSKHSDIMAIGHVHALAFARASNFAVGKPVFFTDMHSGFRGWIVLDSSLYYLHPDDRPLTLAEGVALIRYFLAAQAGGLVASVEGGALVCVPRTLGAGAGDFSAPPSPAPPASSGGDGSRGGSRAKGARRHKGGRGRTSGHIISRAASPEGGGSDLDEDFSTVVMSIAAAREEGGGVPHLVFGREFSEVV